MIHGNHKSHAFIVSIQKLQTSDTYNKKELKKKSQSTKKKLTKESLCGFCGLPNRSAFNWLCFELYLIYPSGRLVLSANGFFCMLCMLGATVISLSPAMLVAAELFVVTTPPQSSMLSTFILLFPISLLFSFCFVIDLHF